MSSNLMFMIWDSFLETLVMVAISGGIGALIGIPLGIVLFITDKKSFLPMPALNSILGATVSPKIDPVHHSSGCNYPANANSGRNFYRNSRSHCAADTLCCTVYCAYC